MNLVCNKFDKLFVKNKKNYVLGNWCLNKKLKKDFKIFLNSEKYETYNQINKNFLLYKKLEEEMITSATNELNFIHNVNFSKRYWQILIGPWLQRAINFLLFKYNNIKKIEKKISSTVRLYDKESYLNCDNTLESIYLQYNLVKSNNLDNEIIKYLFSKVSIIEKKYKSKYLYMPSYKYSKKINMNLSNNVPVFCETPFSILHKSLVYLKLGFLPRFWSFPKEAKIKTDNILRNNLVNKFNKKTKYYEEKRFDIFFKKIFYKIIPTCFLEGCKKNREICQNIGLPRKPYFIFTMSGYTFNEIFRFYIAESSEKKIPIISFQHGSNYGTSNFIANSSIEEKYSNRFLTFGWKEKEKDIPMFLYQKKSLYKSKIKEKILIVIDGIATDTHPYNVYLKNELFKRNMVSFFQNINNKLKKNLILKLHPRTDPRNLEDYRFWKHLKLSQKVGMQIKKNENILSLKKYSKIVVHTYEGTAFYQDISNNTPCIMILKDGLKFIRPSARPLFKLMIRKGIIFEDYKKAAEQVSNLYEKVDEWWNLKDIQEIVEKFRKKYARREADPVQKIVNFLKKI